MSMHKIKPLARIYFIFRMSLDVSFMFQNYSSQILLLSVNEEKNKILLKKKENHIFLRIITL